MTQCRARLQTRDTIVCCTRTEGHVGPHRGEVVWYSPSNLKDAS